MRGSMEMTEQEYRDMYAEYCMEGGERMTDRGFTEFKAWRKRFVREVRAIIAVEKYFDNMKDSS